MDDFIFESDRLLGVQKNC